MVYSTLLVIPILSAMKSDIVSMFRLGCLQRSQPSIKAWQPLIYDKALY